MATVGFEPTTVFSVVDLGGVLANGILGAAVAREFKLDAVGFVTLAIVSGLGGGLVRDTLLQDGPPVALTNPAYLLVALGGAAIAFVVDLQSRWTHRALLLADGLALGCWSATGTVKTLGVGLPWLSAIMLGVVTAVGGGMIRDIVVVRVPQVFGGTLYASVALLTSVVTASFAILGRGEVGFAVAIVLAPLVALQARRRRWRLPPPANLSGRGWRRPGDGE